MGAVEMEERVKAVLLGIAAQAMDGVAPRAIIVRSQMDVKMLLGAALSLTGGMFGFAENVVGVVD